MVASTSPDMTTSPNPAGATSFSPVAALRGSVVALGPSVLLDLICATGTVALATGQLGRQRTRRGRLLRALLAFGAAFPWAYLLGIRPWHRRWGATRRE